MLQTFFARGHHSEDDVTSGKSQVDVEIPEASCFNILPNKQRDQCDEGEGKHNAVG